MDGVVIRPYRGGDEAGIVACWNRACPKETISLSVFVRRVLCDANFSPAGLLIAEREGRLTGFLLSIIRKVPMMGTDLEPNHAWITAFAVDPGFQGQGVGSALFTAAMKYLQEQGRSIVSFSDYAPNYFVPGLDTTTYPRAARFLGDRGFTKAYTCAAMDTNLVLFEIPDDVWATVQTREAEGYRFEPLTPARVADTIGFATDAFHADWGRAVREAIAHGVPFDQFLIAVDPQSTVVGFAMFGGYDGIQERFGPFGVADSQRGKGLGKVLLYLTLDRMRQKGLHSSWFLWTGEQSAAGHLYRRAGFQTTRRFDIMRKRLESHAR